MGRKIIDDKTLPLPLGEPGILPVAETRPMETEGEEGETQRDYEKRLQTERDENAEEIRALYARPYPRSRLDGASGTAGYNKRGR